MKKKLSRIFGVGFVLSITATLLLATFPVAADVSQPAVTVDDDTIATESEYIVLFTVTDAIEADADGEIIITFNDDTDVGDLDGDGDITIQTTAGFGTANDETDIEADQVTVSDETVTIVISDLDEDIGEFAQVKVTFTTDITNPDDPDDYTLEVSTSEEDDEVTSAAYEIEAPDLTALPGVVTLLNSSDIEMENYTGDTAIAEAIAAAGEDYTIKIGPGTYEESPNTADEGVTFEASGAQADTIVEGDWTIDEDETTLEGFLVQGEMTITGDDVTITDMLFEKSDDDAAETLVTADSDDDLTIEDSTFDLTDGEVDDTGIEVTDDDLTVDNCTFLTDEDDRAIQADDDVNIDDSTFDGTGIGVYVDDTSVPDIDGNTFDGLDHAVYVLDGGSGIEIVDNTITNSTADAIYLVAIGLISISNNTVTDTDEDYHVLYVSESDENVLFAFNDITDNDGTIENDDDDNGVNAPNNWWGDADGPDSDSIEGTVTTDPAAGAPVSGALVDFGEDELDAEDEVGVKISVSLESGADEPGVLGAASYATNPKTDPSLPVLSGAFYDVYANNIDVAGDEVTESITVRLYHDDVSSSTQILVWSELSGEYLEASDQGVSLFGGYAYFTVEEVDTVPTFEDLSGIPVVLVTSPDSALPAVAQTAPESGGTDTLLTNVPFTWSSVEDAESYEVVISTSATLSPALVNATAAGTAYTYAGPLEYSSAYYWQVSAIDSDDDVIAVSDIATFTTKDEPAAPAAAPAPAPAPIVNVPAAPAPVVNVEIPAVAPAPAPVVNVPAPAPTPQPVVEVTEITPSWIWAVIGIGALLVITMIVLIVRTRRVS